MNVTGSAAGLHTLRGIGEVQLSNADIYELPVMVALFVGAGIAIARFR